MNRVWALAKITLKAALRSNVLAFATAAYVIILIAVVLLSPDPGRKPGYETAGAVDVERSAVPPAAQRIRFIQSASLGAAFFLAVAVVAVVGGMWLPRQIRGKSLTTVLSKPVGAWQVVLGTWLGFGILSAMMFTVFTVVGIACCRTMAALSPEPVEAAVQLRTLHTEQPRKIGRVVLDEENPGSLRADIIEWKTQNNRRGRAAVSLGSPQEACLWTFECGPDDGQVRCRAVFEIQKRTNPCIDYTDIEIRIWDAKSEKLGPPHVLKMVGGGRPVEFSAARPEGGAEIGVLVRPARVGFDIVCRRKEMFQITGTAPFEVDYFKAFGITGLAVLVFTAITTAASTFLSPNVSVFFAASTGVMGGTVSFFRDFFGARGESGLGIAKALGAQAPPDAFLNPAAGGWDVWARAVGHTLLKTLGDGLELIFRYVLPDWTRFDATQEILSRLNVTLGSYRLSFLCAGVYCVLCIIAGGAILHRREIGAS